MTKCLGCGQKTANNEVWCHNIECYYEILQYPKEVLEAHNKKESSN